jgi:hypothetical protein
MNDRSTAALQPGQFCAYLLRTIDASEGRRKRRKRDTTPDAIGLRIKRDLLERAVEENPLAEEFEAWLLQQVIAASAGGPVHALAREIQAEYWIACHDPEFSRWLADGAPSADAR